MYPPNVKDGHAFSPEVKASDLTGATALDVNGKCFYCNRPREEHELAEKPDGSIITTQRRA